LFTWLYKTVYVILSSSLNATLPDISGGLEIKDIPEVTEETWPSNFGQLVPLSVCDHGKGVYLYDSKDKKYIDFSGGDGKSQYVKGE